jgi:hypothetical protein
LAIVDDWAWVQPAPETVPARNAVRLPIPADNCEDRRYPRLIGDVVVYCIDGTASRALDLRHWTTTSLGADGPWTAIAGGLLSPSGWVSAGKLVKRPFEARGGLASGDGEVAVTLPTLVQWWRFDPKEDPKTGMARFEVAASPLPWYAPAWSGGWLVWVQAGSPGDFDLFAHGPGSNDAVPFAVGPGLQHHVVGSGHTLAWVDGTDVILADTAAHTRARYAAKTGFESDPLVDDGFACWEDRGAVVRCTDGWSTPGRRPSGDRGRILVLRDDGWWLYRTAP